MRKRGLMNKYINSEKWDVKSLILLNHELCLIMLRLLSIFISVGPSCLSRLTYYPSGPLLSVFLLRDLSKNWSEKASWLIFTTGILIHFVDFWKVEFSKTFFSQSDFSPFQLPSSRMVRNRASDLKLVSKYCYQSKLQPCIESSIFKNLTNNMVLQDRLTHRYTRHVNTWRKLSHWNWVLQQVVKYSSNEMS